MARGTVKWMNQHGHTMIAWDTEAQAPYTEDGVEYRTAAQVQDFLRQQSKTHRRIVADPVKKKIIAKPGRKPNIDLKRVDELIVFPQMQGGAHGPTE